MTRGARVRPILDDVRWEPNAPSAEFAAHDSGLAALVMRAHPDDPDQRAVVIYWTGVTSGSFGQPNDEGLHSHPLYSLGLDQLRWAGECDSSAAATAPKHFLIPTKEGLAEVHASDIGVMRANPQTSASTALLMIPRSDQPLPDTELPRVEVESLTDQSNFAVIRLPQRKFPGVVFQGDSLSTIVADASQLAVSAQRGAPDVAELAAHLSEQLASIQHHYEQALAAHRIPLPYVRRDAASTDAMANNVADSETHVVAQEEWERAQYAFFPFVSEFRLGLNPEDVDEILYAVLHHSRSARTYEEIDAAVRAQIAEHFAGIKRMHVAWDRWIADRPWVLKRQDDNGNRFVVSRYLTREEADAAAAEFDARGHKQLYWVEEDRRDRTERD